MEQTHEVKVILNHQVHCGVVVEDEWYALPRVKHAVRFEELLQAQWLSHMPILLIVFLIVHEELHMVSIGRTSWETLTFVILRVGQEARFVTSSGVWKNLCAGFKVHRVDDFFLATLKSSGERSIDKAFDIVKAKITITSEKGQNLALRVYGLVIESISVRWNLQSDPLVQIVWIIVLDHINSLYQNFNTAFKALIFRKIVNFWPWYSLNYLFYPLFCYPFVEKLIHGIGIIWPFFLFFID